MVIINKIVHITFTLFYIYCKKHLGCARGQMYVGVFNILCEACPVGTYSEVDNAFICTRCPEGFSTHSDGRTDRSECVNSKDLNL